MKKIVQTAGRTQLGEFAPEFAHLNDDILFGEVWSRNDLLSLRDRSLVTITSLISQGITDNSLKYHLQSAKNNGITRTEAAEIITHIAFYAGWPKAWAAFNLAKEVWNEDVKGEDAKLGAVEQLGMESQYRIFGKRNTRNGFNLNRLPWSKRGYGHLVKIIFCSAV